MPLVLREITDDIYATIDRFALDLGAKLQRAHEAYPDLYEAWVTDCLPFGLDKARRLRMIHLAAVHLPEHVLARAPRAWQALYAVTRLPVETFTQAVESGTIHPDLTVRESRDVARELSGRETKRFTEAELLVGRLVKLPSVSLGPDARGLLHRWLATEPS